MSMGDLMENINERIKGLENRFSEVGVNTRNVVTSEVKRRWKAEPQMANMFGLTTAMCVSTLDPYYQNNVYFYTPLLHHPDVAIKSLPQAYPISTMGGFDDCGLNWVPPAGTTLCILFDQGHRDGAFYLGTTWHRDRGPEGETNWGYTIEEYNTIYKGHRKGYLVGKNDESQVFPPWNTENYNHYDMYRTGENDVDLEAKKKQTTPNIYGFKTPEKHMWKAVDGDPKCSRRWKRLEMMSGCGNWMIFKDDHMRPSGQWCHPSCGCGGGDVSNCTNNPDKDCDKPKEKPKCANPFFKHKNECRPYSGPGTPQNNKADLNQTGIQFLSISGHTQVMDDSVEEPRGQPTWERSMSPFDFGCTDKYLGRFYQKSATGHMFELSDVESESKVRGDKNYIRLLTATGNKIELNDETTPGGVAGPHRGISMTSSSRHSFEMLDEENEQKSPERREGGVPVNKAKKAFIRLRSGYGLEFLMKDQSSQQETQNQFIQIFSPQKDNKERGPHFMRFQEKPSGPGMVFLRAGGNYVVVTYDAMIEIVGDPDKNPANKITVVSDNYFNLTKKIYYNEAKMHILKADDSIFLLAGNDCTTEGDKENKPKPTPCAYPVVIHRCPSFCHIGQKWHYEPGKSTSERVFASGNSYKPICGGPTGGPG